MRHIIVSPVVFPALPYSSTLCHKRHESRGKKKLLYIKCVFLFFSTILSKKFLTLRRIVVVLFFLVVVLFYVFFVLFYVFLCCSMYFLCCSMYCLFCDVPCIVCAYMCTEQLPPGGYPIAAKYISYHISI